MNDFKKHIVALGLIGILLCFKFVIFPIIDWQDQKLATLALLERKVAKVEWLILNKENTALQTQQLDVKLNKVTQQFYNEVASDKFKLEQQKAIETKLKEFDLAITNIGWKPQLEVENAPLQQFRLEYSVKGDTKNAIDYALNTMNQVPFSEITGLRLLFNRPSMGSLGVVTARIKQSYYMLNKNTDDGRNDNSEDLE